MSEHKISAVLEAKDNFSATIKTANRHLNDMGKTVEKTNSKIKKTESKIQNGFSATEKAAKGVRGAVKETGECIQAGISNLLKFNIAAMAMRGLSAGLDFIKSAFKDFAEFDQVLAKNGSIMNANKEEMKSLKSQALELGKTMPFTAKEVAEAQKYQAMAGMKANQILEMTPKLLKLSIAAGEDLGRTSDILTDNMSAFGLELKDADKFMDIMAATANNSNTSISDLGEAYKYVAATSKNFDSLENVNVMLGVLADNGIKGGVAGRNLAGVMARLSKITPDIREQLAKTGTKLYDQTGKFKGLLQIIRESKEPLKRLTEEERNLWLSTIAGTEGLKIWNSIMNYSAEGMEKVAGAIEKSEGSINSMYDRTKDTPLNKIKALESAWDNLKLTIADKAAPAIVGMIDDLTRKVIELADSETFSKENVEAFFGSIKEGVKGTIEMLELLSAALKPLVWFFKFTSDVANMGHDIGKLVWNKVEQDKISNRYLVQGYTPEEAEKKAKEDIKEAELVSKMSPIEQKKYYENKIKNQIILDKEAELIKIGANIKNGKQQYKGIKYADYAPRVNEVINNSNNNKSLNARNLNENNRLPNVSPQVNISFESITVNNEEAIRRISQEVGEKAGMEFERYMITQYQTQK